MREAGGEDSRGSVAGDEQPISALELLDVLFIEGQSPALFFELANQVHVALLEQGAILQRFGSAVLEADEVLPELHYFGLGELQVQVLLPLLPQEVDLGILLEPLPPGLALILLAGPPLL